MENSFFILLRVGLEIEFPSENSLKRLSTLTFDQWNTLRDMADRQGVSAVAFDGLNSLYIRFGKGLISPDIDSDDWKVFLRDWMGTQLLMEKTNQKQVDVMNDLAKKWSEAGCKVMVMKGQANGMFYPSPDHRAKGDIDCYLFENYSKGNAIAREAGARVDESWYKHSVISYKGETFENHQFFVHTRDGKCGKQMEKELELALCVDSNQFSQLSEYVVCPPVQWTAMFLTYHACAHFVSEGLRLKQVLDWAMFLKKHQSDVDWPSFYEFCGRYHLDRFADVVTSIAKEYLGIQITKDSIRSESPFTERVLHSALYDNDYVFGSGKGNWHNRFHLIRNLWAYRWKYRDIYQMSPLRQLWYYTTGFVFKTE